DDARVARLPPGPRLRAHRGEALGARRRRCAREGAGVKAAELIVTAGSGRARARLARLAARGEAAGGRVEADVRRIIARVRRAGDGALLAFTRRFDGVTLRRGALRVPKEAMAAAYSSLPGRGRGGLAVAGPRLRHLAGVDSLFRIGGAQAVAALAYGTESVPRVDKIVGPGNVWVATAKRLSFGQVDIDSIAGPSEVLVVADGGADAELVAADMLA